MSTVGGDWSRDHEIETEIFEFLLPPVTHPSVCHACFRPRGRGGKKKKRKKREALRIFSPRVSRAFNRHGEWKPEIDVRTPSPYRRSKPRELYRGPRTVWTLSLDRLKFHFGRNSDEYWLSAIRSISKWIYGPCLKNVCDGWGFYIYIISI